MIDDGRYCDTCGAPLEGGESFCTACGTPVALTSARDGMGNPSFGNLPPGQFISSPKRKIIPIILAITGGVLLLGGCAVLIIFGRDIFFPAKEVEGTTNAAVVEIGTEKKSKPKQSISAVEYVPTPNLLLTYNSYYAGGEIEKVEIVTYPQDDSLVGTCDGFGGELFRSRFYQNEQGDIIWESDFAEAEIVHLPATVEMDKAWEEARVLQLDGSIKVTAGFFKDCIVVETKDAEGEPLKNYYAPGIGTVASLDATGEKLSELMSVLRLSGVTYDNAPGYFSVAD